jgi:hypothetical protein
VDTTASSALRHVPELGVACDRRFLPAEGDDLDFASAAQMDVTRYGDVAR